MLEFIDVNKHEFEIDDQLDLYKELTGEIFENIIIINMLNNGQAFIFSPESDLEKGWVVLKPSIHPLTRIPYVLIWLAYSTKGNTTLTYHSQIEKLARDIGAKYVEFNTEFDRVAALAPMAGFTKKYVTYQKEL